MSDNQDDTTNYLRFIAFFIDIATDKVRQVFYHLIQPWKGPIEFFSSPEVKQKVRKLHISKNINKTQINLLDANVPDASKFDISLLIILIFDVVLPISTSSTETNLQTKDLKRLRDIRNSIIAHKPKAVLYKVKFERLWTELKDILERLNNSVSPETTDELLRKIDEYRNRSFSDKDDRDYKQKFEESCEEISRLQNKMEQLSQKCNEFTIFFRKTPEKYFQYVQLLFEGGKFVLINVLIKGLSERKLDLRTVLICKRSDLRESIESSELLRQIYTNDDGTDINIDTKSWDIIVLAEVIEISQCLKERQMKRVKIIKDARKNYADSALNAIANSDIQRFYGCCEDFVSSIEVLSSTLDEDVQIECDEHISKYKAQLTENQVTNYDDYLNKLKTHGTDIKNLSELHKETVAKLKECVKQMKESRIHFDKEHVLHLKMIVLGEDNEMKQIAEDTLQTVMEATLAKSDIAPELEVPILEANKIVEELQAIPNVKIDDVKRECIILSVKCCSVETLLHVIDYLTGEMFKDHLLSLSRELCFVYDEVIAVEGNITFESLNDILTDIYTGSEYTNDESVTDSVCLPVVCNSPEAIQSVLEFVKTDRFTNSINVIADCLSSYVEGTISLKVIPDLKEMSGIFEETAKLHRVWEVAKRKVIIQIDLFVKKLKQKRTKNIQV